MRVCSSAYRSRDKALRHVAEVLGESTARGTVGMQIFERGLLVRTVAGEELLAAAAAFSGSTDGVFAN